MKKVFTNAVLCLSVLFFVVSIFLLRNNSRKSPKKTQVIVNNVQKRKNRYAKVRNRKGAYWLLMTIIVLIILTAISLAIYYFYFRHKNNQGNQLNFEEDDEIKKIISEEDNGINKMIDNLFLAKENNVEDNIENNNVNNKNNENLSIFVCPEKNSHQIRVVLKSYSDKNDYANFFNVVYEKDKKANQKIISKMNGISTDKRNALLNCYAGDEEESTKNSLGSYYEKFVSSISDDFKKIVNIFPNFKNKASCPLINEIFTAYKKIPQNDLNKIAKFHLFNFDYRDPKYGINFVDPKLANNNITNIINNDDVCYGHNKLTTLYAKIKEDFEKTTKQVKTPFLFPTLFSFFILQQILDTEAREIIKKHYGKNK